MRISIVDGLLLKLSMRSSRVLGGFLIPADPNPQPATPLKTLQRSSGSAKASETVGSWGLKFRV